MWSLTPRTLNIWNFDLHVKITQRNNNRTAIHKPIFKRYILWSNSISIYFISSFFCVHATNENFTVCTHFAWPILNYVDAWRPHTFLGAVVQSNCYTCMAFYCYYSTLVVHTLCLDQFHCCTFIHKSSLCSLLDSEYNCTVQLYTRYCQPVLYTILQNQFTNGRIVSTNHRAQNYHNITHTHTQNVHM